MTEQEAQEVSDDMENVLAMLDDLNESGGIHYDDYSRLHDAVARLSPRVVVAVPVPGTLAYAQARAEADGSLDSDEDGYDGPLPPAVVAAPSDTDREALGDVLEAAIADWDSRMYAKEPTRPLADELADVVLSRPSQPVQVEVTTGKVAPDVDA